MSGITESEIKTMTKEQNYMRGYADGKSDVIDKIRAEIDDLDNAEYEFEGYYKAVNDALQIIDNYKLESEG